MCRPEVSTRPRHAVLCAVLSCFTLCCALCGEAWCRLTNNPFACGVAQSKGPYSSRPIKVQGFDGPLTKNRVRDMACGPTYNIACCEGGVTYSWGSAWAGCLGLGDTKSTKIVVSPTQMEALRGQKIVQLAGGQSHVLALTDSCNVWAWGSAEFGKLGLGDVSQLPSDSDGVPLAKVRLRLLLCVHGRGGADMSGVCRAHPCSASHAP